MNMATPRSKRTTQSFRGGEMIYGGSTIQAMMGRAFPLRKNYSSSLEGYWRIHDNCDHEDHKDKDGGHEDPIQKEEVMRCSRRKNKGIRILRACKWLFGS